MYNDSVIQEQSGLNAFYNKIYSLVGIGVGISALVSGLMMTVFQDFFVQIFDNPQHPRLKDFLDKVLNV